MRVYQVPQDLADYHGCGRAWAAIKDGQIVALRYMGDKTPDSDQPQWVRAVQDHANGIDVRGLPVVRGSKQLAAMAKAAQACHDCPTPPRRQRYRPTELLALAREHLYDADAELFRDYRRKCYAELGELGEVASGMCSCYEFIEQG